MVKFVVVFSILSIGSDLVGNCANYRPLAVICAQVAGNAGKSLSRRRSLHKDIDTK